MFSATPQPLSKVLDDGFRLAARGYPKAVLLGLVGAVGNVGTTVLQQFIMTPQGPGAEWVAPLVIGYLASMVLVMISAIAITAHYYSVAMDEPISVKRALGIGLRRAPILLAASIMLGLAILLGLLLLIVPGVILMVSLWLMVVVLVVEQRGPLASLRRSHALVWGNWWRTMMGISVVGIVYIVGVFSIMLVVMAVVILFISVDGPDPEVMMLLSALAEGPLTAMLLPLLYAPTLAIYHDLKVRRDGDDLIARANRLLVPA